MFNLNWKKVFQGGGAAKWCACVLFVPIIQCEDDLKGYGWKKR